MSEYQDRGTRVVFADEFIGRRLEIRKFFGARALEGDIRDAHSRAGDAKIDGVDGAAGLFGLANILGAGSDVERN